MLVRFQWPCDSATAGPERMGEYSSEIRTPFSEVVIGVDDRNAQAARTPLQAGERLHGTQCIPEQRIAVFKAEVVDDIDQQQCHAATVRDIAMEI
jgi:hypothetical protein